MGEIADMVLDGILCEDCGEFIDDETSLNGGNGYPRKCNNYEETKKIKKEVDDERNN